MQSIQNLKENIFSECQNYLQEISKIETPEDLMRHHKAIIHLFEQSQFLKKLSEVEIENPDFSQDNKIEIEELEASNETLKKEYWEILQQKELEISQLSTKIKLLENPEIQSEIILPKTPLENVFAELPKGKENETLISEDSADFEEKETVEKQIKLLQEKESEERRRKIVEFNKAESSGLDPLPIFDEFKKETAIEKKFRLGKIKGLGIVKSLFDDDFLEEKESEPVKINTLHNSNMATDFMEAEKHKQDFRIDLNDKVAFTKLLFKGDEDELRSTINQLNSYKTLDEAKEYLSELYYTKEWKNVDDYAQRLWVLVENKFI